MPKSLKPKLHTTPRTCPFCGEKPVVEPWHGGGPRKTAVSCEGELCRVRPLVTGGTKARAIQYWNRRETD